MGNVTRRDGSATCQQCGRTVGSGLALHSHRAKHARDAVADMAGDAVTWTPAVGDPQRVRVVGLNDDETLVLVDAGRGTFAAAPDELTREGT